MQPSESRQQQQPATADIMPLDTDNMNASELPSQPEVRSHKKRGPRPSPAKSKRDSARADAHRARSQREQAFPMHNQFGVTAADGDAVSLEPIAEVRTVSRSALETETSKRAEKLRLRKQQAEDSAPGAITMSTVTVHAAGDALKAEALCLDVGSTCLLEDARLVISEQTGTYGLLGPNGCGKTTLMRLIAGEYAPEHQLAMPCAWGAPYLVSQMDPEPTGRSPIEEVLSGCKERTALLAEQASVLARLAATELLQELDDAAQRELEQLTEQMAEIDEQLTRWDVAETDVTRILVGLGFHHGEESADGAPSLRARDEIITDSNALKVSDTVEVRDLPDEEWLRGVVTCTDPLLIRPDGFAEDYVWTEVRHSRELSGGWRKKVELAKALWLKPKLLLLDEPTNHLDYHALLWLEEELRERYPHTVVIVSHNACFLKEVCDKALHIAGKRIETLPMGNLSLEVLAAMQRKDEKHRKFRDWRFAFPTGDEPEMHGLSFHNVSFSYSPESPHVLSDIHRDAVRFHGKSRAVILGRNGSGKSTLLKLCLGIVEPTRGEVDVSCEMRHFSQHFNEALERFPEHSAASYLAESCRDGLRRRFHHTDEERLREDACEVLSWFGLGRREAARTSIKDLSGGQKARLNFAFLSLCPSHLLILDEPTNHLDANGLEHLADALSRFEGGVVLVSHDELLIRRVLASSACSELLVCSRGGIQRQSGLRSLDVYRRAALREQHFKAEKASKEAELRLQRSREGRRSSARGRGCASMSRASTREPTPEVQPAMQPESGLQHAKSEMTLKSFFMGKAKKKPKPVNLNAQRLA